MEDAVVRKESVERGTIKPTFFTPQDQKFSKTSNRNMANLISLAGLRKLMLIMLIVWCLVMVASGKFVYKLLDINHII